MKREFIVGKEYYISIFGNISKVYFRTIISGILMLSLSIFFAREMTIAEYGMYNYFVWFISILVPLVSFGLDSSIIKFIPEYYIGEKDKAHALIGYILRKQFIRSLLILIIIFLILINGFYKSDFFNNNLLIISILLAVISNIILNVLAQYSQAIQEFTLFARTSIVGQILNFIFSIVIYIITKELIFLFLIVFLANLLQIIIYFSELKKKIVFSIKSYKELSDYNRIKKYSIYSYFNIIWQQVVFARSEIFFLAIYSSYKEIAIYGIAFNLILILNQIFSPITVVLNNYFSELIAKKDSVSLSKILSEVIENISIILLFIFPFVYIFSEPIINLFYGEDYKGVFTVFIIMFTSFAITQILAITTSIPSFWEKYELVLKTGVFSGALNITLDIILIPIYGAIGAAFANSIAQVLAAGVLFLYVFKKISFKINFRTNFVLSVILTILSIFILSLDVVVINLPLYKLTVLTLYALIYYKINKNNVFNKINFFIEIIKNKRG